MTFLKAWATRVWSGIDRAVAEIEDHDALVEVAIREVAEAARLTRAELDRMAHDGATLRDQLGRERNHADAWRRRAADEASDVEALVLLRRAQRARARADKLRAHLDEHARIEARLVDRVATLTERLDVLERQHREMRSRSAKAEAWAAASFEETPVEALFDRWDMSLAYTEHAGDIDAATFDELAYEQEDHALRRELAELRKKKAG
jgi:phage shock protein A